MGFNALVKFNIYLDMSHFDVLKFSRPCFLLILGVAVTETVFGTELMKKPPDESAIKAVIQPVGRPVSVVIPRPEPPPSSNKPTKNPVGERLSK